MMMMLISSIQSVHGNNLPDCGPDDEYGVTPCVAASEFQVVPDQYKNLPLIDLQTKWAPLKSLPEFVYGSDVTLEMKLAYYLGPAYNTELMTYNGISPPPLIKVKAGDSLNLLLKNTMTNPMGNNIHNNYRLPNVTNIHLHGGHISGNSPGDDVKVEVNPGEEHSYYYEFPTNHMPGTSWYHPHFHGSTSLQTGQGAAGMLIVEDPPGYLPTQVENMPDINLMIQHMDLPALEKSAHESGALWWLDSQGTNSTIVYGNATSDTGNTNLMLVNMQYIPKITIEKGKWYRFRMVMSSVIDGLSWAAPEGCQMQLLAKDGIYLSDAPRSVEIMILAPGNRADVAIKCDMDMTPGVYKMPAVSEGRFWEYETPDSPSNPNNTVPENCGFCITQPNIAVLEVLENSSNNNESEPDIEPFGELLKRPCYLTDLTGLSDEEVGEELTIDYGPAFSVNNVSWIDASTYTKNYTVGTVNQFYLTNNGGHPHHQHVNPFQILSIENRTVNASDPTQVNSFENWYKDGDWQDTLQHISKSAKSRIRWAADGFSGDMFFHCHILTHEDKGMMGQFHLDGLEGGVFEGARSIDPTCVLANEYLTEVVDNTTTTTNNTMTEVVDDSKESSKENESGIGAYAIRLVSF